MTLSLLAKLSKQHFFFSNPLLYSNVIYVTFLCVQCILLFLPPFMLSWYTGGPQSNNNNMCDGCPHISLSIYMYIYKLYIHTEHDEAEFLVIRSPSDFLLSVLKSVQSLIIWASNFSKSTLMSILFLSWGDWKFGLLCTAYDTIVLRRQHPTSNEIYRSDETIIKCQYAGHVSNIHL